MITTELQNKTKRPRSNDSHLGIVINWAGWSRC
jgi:hypothetical protein